MSDLNVNKINANSEIKPTEKLEVKPEESLNSVFNEEATPAPGDEIGRNGYGKISGQIDGKNFTIRRTKDGFSEYFINGEYDGKSIQVSQKGKTFSSKYSYSGKIGEDKVNMQSERKGVFNSTQVYKGTFKGKKFEVEYQTEGLGDASVKGQYGKDYVNIVRDGKTFKKDGIETKSLPKDFAPVSVLILGIQEAKRADQAKAQADMASAQMQMEMIRNDNQ